MKRDRFGLVLIAAVALAAAAIAMTTAVVGAPPGLPPAPPPAPPPALVPAVRTAPAYEFATVAFASGGRLVWTDKAGERAEVAGATPRLFADLSGEADELAATPQAQVLILNGLSRNGWEIVAVTNPPDRQTFLLKRQPSANLPPSSPPVAVADGQVPLAFAGGHDTDRRDGGRPVALVAAALGVPDQVFRDAFTHVTPAGPGREPSRPRSA